MANELTKEDVQRLQQSIDRVEKTLGEALNELRFDLKKIEGYLYDDDDTSTPGIVQKVREHDNRLYKLEEEERTSKKVLAFLGMLGGGIGMAIFEFLKWLFSNK